MSNTVVNIFWYALESATKMKQLPLFPYKFIYETTLIYLVFYINVCWKLMSRSIFTALHGMQTPSSDKKAVRPSVRRLSVSPSVKRVDRSVQIFIPYER